MMLTRTRRTTSSRLRDMKFIDELELPRGMRGENAGKTWCEPSTDHHMNLAFASVMIEREKGTNIGEVIGRADDMNPPTNKVFGEVHLRSCRTSQHYDIDIEW